MFPFLTFIYTVCMTIELSNKEWKAIKCFYDIKTRASEFVDYFEGGMKHETLWKWIKILVISYERLIFMYDFSYWWKEVLLLMRTPVRFFFVFWFEFTWFSSQFMFFFSETDRGQRTNSKNRGQSSEKPGRWSAYACVFCLIWIVEIKRKWALNDKF